VIFELIADRLAAIGRAGLMRRRFAREGAQGPRIRVEGREYLAFCSNDYLGLANHPRVVEAAVDAARRKFSPEFMNRIDKVIVFRTLKREHLEKILDIELERVQRRLMSSTVARQFVFRCTPSACAFLLEEGTDPRFGARHLKRSIERHLVFPVSSLLATRQVDLGDLVTIDHDREDSKLTFSKESWGALVKPNLTCSTGCQPQATGHA